MLYVAVSWIRHETVMRIYSDKLAHVQVVINCLYSIAHLCTSKATLAHNLGALHFDDVMSYNSLTTVCMFDSMCSQLHLKTCFASDWSTLTPTLNLASFESFLGSILSFPKPNQPYLTWLNNGAMFLVSETSSSQL